MKLFYCETGMGACIRTGMTEKGVERRLLREVGSLHGVQCVREATEKDIGHVRAMGGYIPKLGNGRSSGQEGRDGK